MLRDDLLVEEIDGQFVVVKRKMWEQEHPTAMRSIVGSAMLAAGPYQTRTEADRALASLSRQAG